MESSAKSKRQIIDEKAAFLFRKKGYTATSMQDIAEAVNIKAASLYNHIKSKQELLSNMLITIAEEFSSGMDDIKNSSLSEFQKLDALVDLHVQMTLKYSDSISLITGEWVHLGEPILMRYKKLRTRYENDFLQILNSCKQRGHISKEINLDLALYSILSSLHWLYSWHNKNKSTSKIELEHQLKQILLKGIVK